MGNILSDPEQYGLVTLEDGRTYWVNDYAFADDWLGQKGWLSVFTLEFGAPLTIRSDPSSQVHDGIAAKIVSLEPIEKDALRVLREEALAKFDPRRA